MASQDTKANEAVDLEFARDWVTDCHRLGSRLDAVRVRGVWTDCQLVVGHGAERVSAHRVLLASASPVLANMLYGPLASGDSDRPLALPDVHPDAFQLVLDYMYTDNISINSCQVACKLFQVAHFLILPHLQAVSKTYLLNNVTPDCVIHVYEFIQVYDERDILEACLKVMASETTEVLAGQELKTARADTVEILFSLPTLNLSSELELFKAAELWVQVKTFDPKREIGNCEHLHNDDKKEAKTAVRSALRHIRFLTLHPEEFAEYDTSSLLSESDNLAILKHLTTRKTQMPMPIGFSTSTKKRCQKSYKVEIKVPILKTDNVSIGLDPSCVYKLEWTLNIKRTIRNWLSLSIECRPELENIMKPWSCEAKLNVTILSEKKASDYNWARSHRFHRRFTTKQLFPPHFISLERLLDPKDGYLNGNVITLQVKIDAQPPIFA